MCDPLRSLLIMIYYKLKIPSGIEMFQSVISKSQLGCVRFTSWQDCYERRPHSGSGPDSGSEQSHPGPGDVTAGKASVSHQVAGLEGTMGAHPTSSSLYKNLTQACYD